MIKKDLHIAQTFGKGKGVGRMTSESTNQSSHYSHLPAKILLFLPICDNDLSTATILAWCYELEAVAVNNWKQQNLEEQRIEDEKRTSMTDDEWKNTKKIKWILRMNVT